MRETVEEVCTEQKYVQNNSILRETETEHDNLWLLPMAFLLPNLTVAGRKGNGPDVVTEEWWKLVSYWSSKERDTTRHWTTNCWDIFHDETMRDRWE